MGEDNIYSTGLLLPIVDRTQLQDLLHSFWPKPWFFLMNLVPLSLHLTTIFKLLKWKRRKRNCLACTRIQKLYLWCYNYYLNGLMHVAFILERNIGQYSHILNVLSLNNYIDCIFFHQYTFVLPLRLELHFSLRK